MSLSHKCNERAAQRTAQMQPVRRGPRIASRRGLRSAAHRANATSPQRSYVNVECGNAADKSNGRNINASFPNNSNVPIEVVVFIFYSDEIAIDVKTGLVTRHKN